MGKLVRTIKERVRVSGFQKDTSGTCEIKGQIDGPARILGIYRRQHNNKDTTTGTTCTIDATVGNRHLTEEGMLWHDEMFNPANAGDYFSFNEDLAEGETLDLSFLNTGQTKVVSGWLLYVRPVEIERMLGSIQESG